MRGNATFKRPGVAWGCVGRKVKDALLSPVEADMSTRFWKLRNPYGASRDQIGTNLFELCLSCAMRGLSTNYEDRLAQKAAGGMELSAE